MNLWQRQKLAALGYKRTSDIVVGLQHICCILYSPYSTTNQQQIEVIEFEH